MRKQQRIIQQASGESELLRVDKGEGECSSRLRHAERAEFFMHVFYAPYHPVRRIISVKQKLLLPLHCL